MTDRTRKFLKYLRLTWTGFFAVVTVLLCVLWLRSYWWVEQASLPIGQSRCLYFGSVPGAFMFGVTSEPWPETYSSEPADAWLADALDDEDTPWSSARKFRLMGGAVMLPYWFGSSSAPLIALAPWTRLRFSLRTLLIATTLVAVLLGIFVYAMK